MTTVNLNELELNEFVGQINPRQHCKATFPLLAAHGSKKLATVYFELEPGDHLGRHTDSAEELLLVLEGEIQAFVGEESGVVSAGSLVLIPEMVPHDLHNTGIGRAKVLGVFGGANNIVATFDEAMNPTESNIVDTARLFG